MIRIQTRYKSRCSACGGEIPIGESVNYNAAEKKVSHVNCQQQQEPAPTDAEALAERLGFTRDEAGGVSE